MKRFAAWVCLFSAFIFTPSAFAEVPQLINYQGRLLSGTNLVNGTVGLSLRLFKVPAGGTSLYEDSNTVTVADGLYSTFIGWPVNSSPEPTGSCNGYDALLRRSRIIATQRSKLAPTRSILFEKIRRGTP